MKSIEYLVNRYKWGERTYKDHCFPGEYDNNEFTFSNNMRRALQVTTDMTKTLYDEINAGIDND